MSVSLADALNKLWEAQIGGERLVGSRGDHDESSQTRAQLARDALVQCADALSNAWLKTTYSCAGAERPIVFVAGPSGSGKSTVVKHLAKKANAHYVEDASQNPFLPGLYNKPSDFDAWRCQKWFLDQIDTFIHDHGSGETLVIDQLPSAVVRVYSKSLLRDGRLTVADYLSLSSDLIRVEARIAQSMRSCIVVFVDADETTLLARMRARGDNEAPDLAWLRGIRGYFLSLQSEITGSQLVSTVGKSIEQVTQTVATLAGLND